MAKVANPYGLRPVRRLDGLPFAGQLRHLKIESGYNTNIFMGDIVAVDAQGHLVKVTATDDFPAGTVGVFHGVQLFTGGPHPVAVPFGDRWLAGTQEPDARGYVVDDPNVTFMIQATGPITQDMLHNNFAIVNPADEVGQQYSRIALDHTTADVSDDLPLKVIDFVTSPDSQVGDAFTDVIVKFNPGFHAYLSGTGI